MLQRTAITRLRVRFNGESCASRPTSSTSNSKRKRKSALFDLDASRSTRKMQTSSLAIYCLHHRGRMASTMSQRSKGVAVPRHSRSESKSGSRRSNRKEKMAATSVSSSGCTSKTRSASAKESRERGLKMTRSVIGGSVFQLQVLPTSWRVKPTTSPDAECELDQPLHWGTFCDSHVVAVLTLRTEISRRLGSQVRAVVCPNAVCAHARDQCFIAKTLHGRNLGERAREAAAQTEGLHREPHVRALQGRELAQKDRSACKR